MAAWQALLALAAAARLLVSPAAAEFGHAPAPGIVCGDARTRVTVCLPGSPDNATCTYSVISNFSPNSLALNISQLPCPDGPIFGADCASLAGSLYVAYGPCNSDDVVPPRTAANSRSVGDWLDLIGINSLQELGMLFVRGYAFQQQFPFEPDTLLPALRKLNPPTEDQLASFNYIQVMVSGQQVPMLPWVTSLPNGISILNSPDVDFTDPPRFQRLTSIANILRIAGCNRLRSLAGLEGLRTGAEVTKLELISLPRLTDISALAGFYRCTPDGGTLMQPDFIFGVIGAHTPTIMASGGGCALNTVGQLCAFVAQPDRCPPNTEYIRFNDGTLQRVNTNIPPPAAAPGPAVTAPVPAPAPALAAAPAVAQAQSEAQLFTSRLAPPRVG